MHKELLALLSRLDKTGQGHVSLDEFVKGLQAFSGAATVSSTPLPYPLFGFDKREVNKITSALIPHLCYSPFQFLANLLIPHTTHRKKKP